MMDEPRCYSCWYEGLGECFHPNHITDSGPGPLVEGGCEDFLDRKTKMKETWESFDEETKGAIRDINDIMLDKFQPSQTQMEGEKK